MAVNGEEEDLGEHLYGKTVDGHETVDRHEQAREVGVLLFQAMNLCVVVGKFSSQGGVVMVNGPHW